jgi:hypothetical protein
MINREERLQELEQRIRVYMRRRRLRRLARRAGLVLLALACSTLIWHLLLGSRPNG